MTNHQQILEKAIQKAMARGWEPKHPFSWELDTSRPSNARHPRIKKLHVEHKGVYEDDYCIPVDEMSIYYLCVIFNHDFAKALWGEEDAHEKFGLSADVTICPLWQYHLQQMVVADNPIKYLGENL